MNRVARTLIPQPTWYWVGLSILLACSGCATYQFGPRSLYRSDLRTIHIPIFESDSLRPWLGERLTEAVVKEVQLRTPYQVTSSPMADSLLSGRILEVTKRTTVEDRNDYPRDIDLGIVVEIQWVDQRGGLMLGNVQIPVCPLLVSLSSTDSFIPEAGQSLASASQNAIEQLARQIVDQMEMRW